MRKYNWACIGCGHIAGEMAEALEQKGMNFYALYSRTQKKAEFFARRFGIEKVYGSIGEMLGDKSIDIVYIATPHNRHLEYIIKAAQAGKHILCEKAITLNSDELALAKKACEENGVILAEAMTIYHMPVFKEAEKIIKSQSLGRLKLIEVNLGTSKEYDMTNRFFAKELAGGAMLDIGVYALSFARFFMSENPTEIKSVYTLAPTGVDEQAVILLNNGANEMASVTLSLTAKLPRRGTASFENGYIDFESYNRSTAATVYFNDGRKPLRLESNPDLSPLTYEIEDMEAALNGENIMRLDLTKDVMEIMTGLRSEWKVRYPEEEG